ncbi:hypothetical protein HUF18_08170 [Thalassolituus sp. ST750PaO-4]|uniref:hypothetical protein n=1 Tax=Thalassolituus sp. ST750PaO-4 TaxID=2742965 RepID=UPI001CE304C9|nr:hypothetical protein [Thalassolituus sp. ST750PaO-4]MCA6059745.1 hypothetical protein [Thalassolituus sp. ST750PaO-4]
MNYVLVCDEPITAALECSSGWKVTAYTQSFDISELSPETALSYFSAGFILPVVPLAAALGVAVLLKSIKG